MHKVRVLCGAAAFALIACLAPTVHADEWNKLTYFTFNTPIEMPGMVLPAGTYRFELADPDTSRRVVRVSDKEGTKVEGIFLSISNSMLEPSNKPLVMFKEAPAGAPEAVKAWFYPGETTGYEFVYPHDQALKIAKSTHAPVLSGKGDVASTTASADTRHIDENGNQVPDHHAKTTVSTPPSTATAAATPAAEPAPTTAAPAAPTPTVQAPATVAPQPVTTAREQTATPRRPVATTGQAQARTNAAPRSLPKTASLLPLFELLSALALGGGVTVRRVRLALQ